ncbi:unnamed protein product [Caenorhabditis angaria]|uniref:Uncharacterized protein n=1 Tax=Caenorhabditis angaria TaxID=860376 RepID=A0A9P1J244_9PELO|nr:unnamed protein product [Caenorhabditis angaria]
MEQRSRDRSPSPTAEELAVWEKQLLDDPDEEMTDTTLNSDANNEEIPVEQFQELAVSVPQTRKAEESNVPTNQHEGTPPKPNDKLGRFEDKFMSMSEVAEFLTNKSTAELKASIRGMKISSGVRIIRAELQRRQRVIYRYTKLNDLTVYELRDKQSKKDISDNEMMLGYEISKNRRSQSPDPTTEESRFRECMEQAYTESKRRYVHRRKHRLPSPRFRQQNGEFIRIEPTQHPWKKKKSSDQHHAKAPDHKGFAKTVRFQATCRAQAKRSCREPPK